MRFFIKQNRKESGDLLKAEYQALCEIRKTETIRCPEPFFFDVFPEIGAILALEYLELHPLGADSAQLLGEKLVSLHQNTSDRFGFTAANFIGATHQPNKWMENWGHFFWEERIRFQLQLASKNGYSFPGISISRLENAVLKALENRSPSPSLLHGDLWGGNAAALPDGTPVVFDPASYYGDPEADIAFTEVFGGFPRDFYTAYQLHANWDEEGYALRKNIYNLYHYLNHLNLFGSGYFSSCARIIEETIRRYGN